MINSGSVLYARPASASAEQLIFGGGQPSSLWYSGALKRPGLIPLFVTIPGVRPGSRPTWKTAALWKKVMAAHASVRTTQLYDRRRDDVTLDEVVKINIGG